MKKLILAVVGSNSKNETSNDINCPHNGYYGGLLNQNAYGK